MSKSLRLKCSSNNKKLLMTSRMLIVVPKPTFSRKSRSKALRISMTRSFTHRYRKTLLTFKPRERTKTCKNNNRTKKRKFGRTYWIADCKTDRLRTRTKENRLGIRSILITVLVNWIKVPKKKTCPRNLAISKNW